ENELLSSVGSNQRRVRPPDPPTVMQEGDTVKKLVRRIELRQRHLEFHPLAGFRQVAQRSRLLGEKCQAVRRNLVAPAEEARRVTVEGTQEPVRRVVVLAQLRYVERAPVGRVGPPAVACDQGDEVLRCRLRVELDPGRQLAPLWPLTQIDKVLNPVRAGADGGRSAGGVVAVGLVAPFVPVGGDAAATSRR